MNTFNENPVFTKKPGIIQALIVKDIQLNIGPLVLYLVMGLISLWLLTFEAKGPFYAGSVILLSMIIVAMAQLIFNTVINDRNDQTLAFVMSLPITFLQYTHAKVCANVTAFMIFWLIMVGGLLAVIYSQPQIPDGLAVYATILMLEMLCVFFLLLAVGLISESQTWTIVIMALTNIGLSLFMFWLSSVNDIKVHMDSTSAVWNGTAMTIIAAEFIFIAVVLLLTYYIQGRKKDFL